MQKYNIQIPEAFQNIPDTNSGIPGLRPDTIPNDASLYSSVNNLKVNEALSAAGSLSYDLLVNMGKTLIYTTKFASAYSSKAYLDAQSALNEGLLNNKESLFGLPVWDTVTFEYLIPNSTYSNNGGEILSVTLNIALITIAQTKNIVTTAVQGLNGTIKEYISDGDYQINIKAQIVGDAPDYYPAEQVKALKEILSISDSINILSTILNKYFNLENVVVKNYSFNQPEVGMRNVQSVEIECLSDNPNNYYAIIQS